MKPSNKSEPPESSDAQLSSSQDVVLVHGVTQDGEGLAVIRKRDDRLELGAVHPLKEGKPIHGEVVRLKPRAECPLLCDVEVAMPASTASSDVKAERALGDGARRKGPAQVSSASYRDNWDAIWKSRHKKPELAN